MIQIADGVAHDHGARRRAHRNDEGFVEPQIVDLRIDLLLSGRVGFGTSGGNQSSVAIVLVAFVVGKRVKHRRGGVVRQRIQCRPAVDHVRAGDPNEVVEILGNSKCRNATLGRSSGN